MPVALAVALALAGMAVPPQFHPGEIFAVGALIAGTADADAPTATLREMQQAHFTIVDARTPGAERPPRLLLIDRLLARTQDARWTPSDPGVRIVAVNPSDSPALLAARAWRALGTGASAIVFDDWRRLRDQPDLLTAASAFAGEVTRNAPLYSRLRPRSRPGEMQIDGASAEFLATFLESPDALVLLAINDAAPRQVTFTFSADVPEAIWQNMLGGGAVNFVAGRSGPTYTRAFAGHDVLLLMIRKRWR